MNAGVCGGKRCGCNAPLFTGYPFTSAYNKMKEALLDQALLKEVALQVVQQGLLSNWRFYAALLALSLISGAAGAFLSKYFGKRAETAAVDADLKKILNYHKEKSEAEKRGELAATKADFKKILEQLKETTVLTEQVRSKVDHADWVAREWKTIRRVKLEELLQHVASTEKWLDQQYDSCRALYFDPNIKKEHYLTSPLDQIQILTALYFPELKEQIEDLVQNSSETKKWLFSILPKKTEEVISDTREKERRWQNRHSEWQKRWNDLTLLRIQVLEKAKSVMCNSVMQ